MAVADAEKTAQALNAANMQADAALVAALTILRALFKKDLLTAAEAGEIATESVAMVQPSRRATTLAFIATFLPDYQPPRFSAFGQGLAPSFPQAGDATAGSNLPTQE